MLNILMPIAGRSGFFDSPEYQYPKPLIEIKGKTMIEWAVNDYLKVKEDKRFIFIVNTADCAKYHIDRVLSLLTDNQCEIIRLEKETKGAACSALMAIDYIDNDDKLVIGNSDQIFDINLNDVLKHFEKRNVDAGVISFNTVHPRWSYVRLTEDQKIIEAAEKRPLSKEAVAGFYYFNKGKFFIESAMNSIEKGASVEGAYYIAPVFNELILQSKNLEVYKINNNKYHTFYSPQKIEEFEQR